MKTAHHVSLRNLLSPFASEREQIAASAVDTTFFADQRGFHIYGKLGLELRLSAAEDDKSANRYLRILKAYAAIYERAASIWGLEILEIQGEVVHCFLPALNASADAVWKILGFSNAVTEAVYKFIPRLAGDSFKGFKMATDHGRSIMVRLDDGFSIVSLGPCANTPAKRLSAVPAAHLSLKSVHWASISDDHVRSTWVDINVLQPTQYVKNGVDQMPEKEMTMNFANSQNWDFDELREIPLKVLSGPISFDFSADIQPARVKGFFFRADQDGFSKEVEKAFASESDKAISTLVLKFCDTVARSKLFANTNVWSTINLPWAGDCANAVLLPRAGQTYEAMAEKTPFSASKAWHELWLDRYDQPCWAVGMAGGNGAEGNDGVILLSTIHAAGRLFPVAAGWGVRRSQDAYQADGMSGKDSAIPIVDRRKLDEAYQTAFLNLNSLFDKATLKKMQEAEKARLEKLVYQPVKASVPITAVPKPRPYSPHAIQGIYDGRF